ncbi:hypothetical protein A3842_00275 [Paenibacillus sp. P3E]|uniref:hypothetical protein n=1 Tax=Paenibacillus sp. P3E TaxID=1349435 RepID=UPI00093F4AC2|nr:hypothetical protein [Paenibacillus sp. P3E]OKP93119.1 hypothetical protein A3842_00275 [Paenibacillus sp. P3E]
MTITKTYEAKVVVEGDFAGIGDPDLEAAAKQQADNMSHDSWDYKDTEFDVHFIELFNMEKQKKR